MIANFFEKHHQLTLDYFKIADPKTLKEFDLEEPIDRRSDLYRSNIWEKLG